MKQQCQHYAPSTFLAKYKVTQPNAFRLSHFAIIWLSPGLSFRALVRAFLIHSLWWIYPSISFIGKKIIYIYPLYKKDWYLRCVHLSNKKCFGILRYASSISRQDKVMFSPKHFEEMEYKTASDCSLITSQYITLNCIALRYIALHDITYIKLHDITLQYITYIHYIAYSILHVYFTLHYKLTLHSIPLHYVTQHDTTLHQSRLHYSRLGYIKLDCATWYWLETVTLEYIRVE